MPRTESSLGISMVIPVYNTGEALSENIEAVVAQPFECPRELILVDDGSIDTDTEAIIKQAVRKHSFIGHIALGENKGVQTARSIGIEAAKYKYTQTIDGDDMLNINSELLTKGTFADRALAIMENGNETAFVHCFSEMFGDYQGPTISCYPTSDEQVLRKHHMQTSIIYRKADAVAAGLYAPSIRKWQDWSFAVGLLNARYISGQPQKIACVEDFYFKYRIHADTERLSAQPVSELDMVRETIRLYPEIFRRHYPEVAEAELAEEVLNHKPDHLVDLLHVAQYNLALAQRVRRIRDFQLSSNADHLSIS